MIHFKLPRLDKDDKLRNMLLDYCRFSPGKIWKDKKNKHQIACLDAGEPESIKDWMGKNKAVLAIHDPPYNMVAFRKERPEVFTGWCKLWVDVSYDVMAENSSLYIWLGADQKKNFEPFPDFISMMKGTGFKSKSFITMRNQRGYGTQKNWMSVRQELLYYIKGFPLFNTEGEYTEIKKVTGGYYKKVRGEIKENLARSKSDTIRAGNVWTDIQQVFYLMQENVNGCYAQKPLKSSERILKASSAKDELVIDFFAHSGSTLLASEKLGRRCFTTDIDPVYCEISLRRLERYRETGKVGWQNSNPFEKEIIKDKRIKKHLKSKYGIEIPETLA